MIRSVIVAALALGLGLGPSAAWATSISQGGTINLTFEGINGVGGSNTDVHGTGSIAVTLLNSTTITFDISLSNTSTAPGTRFTGFGFEMTPGPTGFADFPPTDTGGATDTDVFTFISNNNLPNFSLINICAFANNNCSSGTTGLLNGETDRFGFSLSGTFGSSVDLSFITVRVTGCDRCSFEIPAGTSEGRTGSTESPVPVPGTLVLLGLGLVGITAVERLRSLRRKK